jgi:hypothetical protein
MSRENVEILQRAVDGYNRGDWGLIASLIGADARMTPLENWPEPGPFVGRDEIVREFQRLRENFVGKSRITMEGATEHGGWLIARYRWTVEGTASGAQVDASLSGAFRFADGEIAEAHYRFEQESVLQAAGLSE